MKLATLRAPLPNNSFFKKKMKRVVLLISFLAFSSSCSSSTTATPNQVLQVVRDTNGEILRSDARYFVVMPSIISGGGVTRGPIFDSQNGAAHANFVCPSQVCLINLFW